MLERDLEIAMFAWSERRCLRSEHSAGFPQNDLPELIGKFHGELDIGEREIAGVREAASKRGDFLIQEILGAAQWELLDLNVGRVGLFGRTKRKMRFARARTGTALRARPHQYGEGDGDRGGAHPRNPGASGFLLWLIGSFDLQSVRHGFKDDAGLKERGRQACVQDTGARNA